MLVTLDVDVVDRSAVPVVDPYWLLLVYKLTSSVVMASK